MILDCCLKREGERILLTLFFFQTESMEEANRLKYPLHLAGTALQLFQLAALKGFGTEPDLAVSRIWDGADGPLFPRSRV